MKGGQCHLLIAFMCAISLAAGCGDDMPAEVANVNVAGAWRYDWQVRDDIHWHGVLQLAQDGLDVTGTIGYPDEDPAAAAGDPAILAEWRWLVYGVVDGAEMHLFAVAPRTLWDDDWKFHLVVGESVMAGPSWAGAANVEKWPFSAQRVSTE